MLRANVRIVVALTIIASVVKAKDETPKLPPRLAVVSRLDEQNGKVILAGVTMRIVREVSETKNGMLRDDLKTIYEQYEDSIVLKDAKVFDAGGKVVAEEDVWKRAKAGSVVVISANGKNVDPLFLNVLDKNTLVFVSPPRIVPVPGPGVAGPVPAGIYADPGLRSAPAFSPPGAVPVLPRRATFPPVAVPGGAFVPAPAPAANPAGWPTPYGPDPEPVPAVKNSPVPLIPQ